jgi:hypothetical protein
LISLAWAAFGPTLACSSAPDRAPLLGDYVGDPGPDSGSDTLRFPEAEDPNEDAAPADAPANHREAPCRVGASRSCVIDLGWHRGIHDCAPGTEVCGASGWGPCIADDGKGAL